MSPRYECFFSLELSDVRGKTDDLSISNCLVPAHSVINEIINNFIPNTNLKIRLNFESQELLNDLVSLAEYWMIIFGKSQPMSLHFTIKVVQERFFRWISFLASRP